MKQSVTQEHDFGCGVACVAFITGKTYKQVACALGEMEAKVRGFYCKDLKEYLRSEGLEYGYRLAKPHTLHLAYQEGSIVFIRRSKTFPAGHYVTWHEGKWMDPWCNFAINHNISAAKSCFREYIPGEIQHILYVVK